MNLAYYCVPTHSQNLYKGYIFRPFPNDPSNAGRAYTAEGRRNFCEQYYLRNVLLEADREILKQATIKQNTMVDDFVSESEEMMAKMSVYDE